MKLDDGVMQGNVLYIHSLWQADSDLHIKFPGDPEETGIVRELSFAGIKEYGEDWYERDDECIEMLLGLHEEPEGAGVEYMLHTDRRELWFYSETEHKVEDVVSNAA